MPNYTYHCDKCAHQFDVHQDFSENSLTTCPKCGQETLLKIYRPARIMFKGSGFYVNDNKSSSRNYLSDKKSDESNSSNGSNGTTSKSDAPAKPAESAKSEPKAAESK